MIQRTIIARRSPAAREEVLLDRTKNETARVATQIRIGHWRSAVYLKRIRKREDDGCWFFSGRKRMTRSHILLHCPNDKLRAAREAAWASKDPGDVRVFLENSRWEKRLLRFLSGLPRA
jgi:hypothetical protein